MLIDKQKLASIPFVAILHLQDGVITEIDFSISIIFEN